MGISESTLQRWKDGESFPELPNLEKLAVALNVHPLEFYQAEYTPKPMPVSSALKKMMAIPDEVYELASELDLDDSVWPEIIESLMIAVEQKNIAKGG